MPLNYKIKTNESSLALQYVYITSAFVPSYILNHYTLAN